MIPEAASDSWAALEPKHLVAQRPPYTAARSERKPEPEREFVPIHSQNRRRVPGMLFPGAFAERSLWSKMGVGYAQDPGR